MDFAGTTAAWLVGYGAGVAASVLVYSVKDWLARRQEDSRRVPPMPADPPTAGRFPSGDDRLGRPFAVVTEGDGFASITPDIGQILMVRESGAFGEFVVWPGETAAFRTPFEWRVLPVEPPEPLSPTVGGNLRPKCRTCGAPAGTPCARDGDAAMPCGLDSI